MMRAMRSGLRTFIAVVAALVPALACAATTLRLEDMTTAELREAIGAGKTTILVPIGGTEQSGAHIALGKHNRRAVLLSERIAEALGNALVAPVVAYVPEGSVDAPAGHLRFAGTITIPPETFMTTLESAARSFRLHGFRDIVFLGDHGGYQRDIASAARRLNQRWASDAARAHALPEYYRIVEDAYPRLLRARGFTDAEVGLHGGLADTALMLALDPALVRSDKMRPGAGVNGDPQRATPALGQLGVDLIVSQTTSAIRKAASRR